MADPGAVSREIPVVPVLESSIEVFNAWNDAGPVPSVHHKAKRKLRSEWPALAGALDQLTAIITNDPEPRP